MARASDVACRYGGEEFIIVFPEFRISAVAQRAEQIRQAAEAMQVTYNGRALPQVTFSLGVAGFPVHGDTPEVIIRQADAALYSAKHLGRNRVVVASRSPSSRKS
jgi:diguanylate cyclase (GGDEF)-like protein